MLPLPTYTTKRRCRVSHLHLLTGTALFGLCAYTLLLFSSQTRTHLGQQVQHLRSLPSDFTQTSSRQGGVIDEDVLVETLATVDGLRTEFDRQEKEYESRKGWPNWILSPFSIGRDALVVSSTRSYPSCPTRADPHYASSLYQKRVFTAINLLQNEELMPTLTRELVALIRVLGPDRVFVSIYENASMDLTVMHLRLLCQVRFGDLSHRRDLAHTSRYSTPSELHTESSLKASQSSNKKKTDTGSHDSRPYATQLSNRSRTHRNSIRCYG
ncbi:hypothetical protein ACGC1H_003307 [Rhizoctonia solani]